VKQLGVNEVDAETFRIWNRLAAQIQATYLGLFGRIEQNVGAFLARR
jgi:hypothetical protein